MMEINHDNSKSKSNCTLCGKIFSTKGNLYRHLKNVHFLSNNDSEQKSKGKFDCNVCGIKCSTKGNLSRHINEKHPRSYDTGLIECPACKECYSRCDSLFRHIDTKHKGKYGICLVCNEKFADLKILFKHTQKEHKSENSEEEKHVTCHRCDLCDSSFSCKHNLNKHIQTFHKDERKSPTLCVIQSTYSMHECPMCDTEFQTVVMLENHLLEVHSVKQETVEGELHSIEAQEISVGNCVTSLVKFKALLNVALSVADTATDEAVSKAVPQLDSLVEYLQQNKIHQESAIPSTTPKIPLNLPSHKNLQKQRIISTNKPWKPSVRRLAKPTNTKKASIKAAVSDSNYHGSIIHRDFDHNYYCVPAKSS